MRLALLAVFLFSTGHLWAQDVEHVAVPEDRVSEESTTVDQAREAYQTREAYEGREAYEQRGGYEPAAVGAAGDIGGPPDEHETQWQAATKLMALDIEDVPATHHTEQQCLNLTDVQPGQMGFVDFYLFKVLERSSRELVLEAANAKPIGVTGLDTEEIEKDQTVVVTGHVQAKGMKSYKTAAGETIKIRVIRVLGKKESEALEIELAAQTIDQPIRTWTSADGKHKTEAKFLKFESGKVHLQNKAGKVVTLSPNALSLEDRIHYRDLVKKARDTARKSLKPKEEPAGTQ